MKKLIHGGDIYSERNIDMIVDFSANINPFGLPTSVKEAIVNNIDNYMNYPDPLCRELRQAIAKCEFTQVGNIICGNGAADIIFKVVLALKPKKTLLIAPTFSEYEESIRYIDGEIKYYNLKEDKDFNIEQDILDYITPDLDMMFICNPNNPTGIPVKSKEMIKIVKRCKENHVILVVDECFIDFLKDEEQYSISKFIENYKNLIILKAFTKIYAMAGIRLGYMLCSNEGILDKINGIGQPWSVSTVASKCGVAALNEVEYVKKSKENIEGNREYLIGKLKELGFKVFNSKANFIFFKSKDRNLDSKLEGQGILIRSCKNYKNLSDEFFRIAVKSQKDNEYLISCLENIGSNLDVGNNGCN
ncbi:aminotransferase class I/II-fold pyridoxal phosphate-dependent enzyme [Clostridium sp. SHJSY1]|uniref:pyridoxal phosphate-dependent aminotransferase n=1 Tax=Clostridium sp. SHJSY1 TaxID=2942483 RepID=UPI002874677A|nr:histidinol-phosphate transaminase [Clostridium sp. SHJSY1]MDS0528205.1 aminotransferase class I/II-fold pyridoxal phosphate-dependent enzyme [Clostridium sp. SHJSY1]